ncbi:hypothetical protein H6F67_00555 [Microcoleus sp. FACHB-1515]|uniref:hypothetical protein n=1 Tax=Cyanophyceae TaxID=3028117 RepID=UPI0016822C64|nr:hypothetical protein [Microcoleus sp. FACHB-1515]MBD2088363.1 hypothetical protein [Microcoleus sp. FACHB-1515]
MTTNPPEGVDRSVNQMIEAIDAIVAELNQTVNALHSAVVETADAYSLSRTALKKVREHRNEVVAMVENLRGDR